VPVFVKDPSSHLADLITDLPCALDPAQKAVIDPAHLSVVNFESFYFATPMAKAQFEGELLSRCGPVTDPVIYRRFVPTKKSPSLKYEGRTFFFYSDSTRAVFAADADSFWLPHWGMVDMAKMAAM